MEALGHSNDEQAIRTELIGLSGRRPPSRIRRFLNSRVYSGTTAAHDGLEHAFQKPPASARRAALVRRTDRTGKSIGAD
jgi:hypothetical protein